MDFTKFVSLIDRSELFFARGDKFEDLYEGYPTLRDLEEHRELLMKNVPLDAQKATESIREMWHGFRKKVGMSCWHMNPGESAAMWKLYLQSNDGVAIRTTVARLTECLNANTQFDSIMGKVRYIDYRQERMEPGTVFTPLIHKRLSFSHEQEVRVVAMRRHEAGVDIAVFDDDIEGGGIRFKIDLERLIDHVFVAPTSPEWFSSLVTAVLAKYGLSRLGVEKSDLSSGPVY
jgi:hypothetical protein